MENLLTVMSTKPAINHLLDCLSVTTRNWFIDNCSLIELVFGDPLSLANEPIKHVYFPTSGCISLFTEPIDNQSLEMSLIGNEGVLGATLALGNTHAPMKSIVQTAGSALRMDASLFIEGVNSSIQVKQLIHSYLYVSILQLAQTGACNRFHEVKQRLARWLLTTYDRTNADSLHLTHQFLSEMLGVRRSAITIAAHSMQQQGIITYSRGEVVVLSEQGLKDISCSCYQAAIMTYRKHLCSHHAHVNDASEK